MRGLVVVALLMTSGVAHATQRPVTMEDLQAQLNRLERLVVNQSETHHRERKALADYESCHESCDKNSPWPEVKNEEERATDWAQYADEKAKSCHAQCEKIRPAGAGGW